MLYVAGLVYILVLPYTYPIYTLYLYYYTYIP